MGALGNLRGCGCGSATGTGIRSESDSNVTVDISMIGGPMFSNVEKWIHAQIKISIHPLIPSIIYSRGCLLGRPQTRWRYWYKPEPLQVPFHAHQASRQWFNPQPIKLRQRKPRQRKPGYETTNIHSVMTSSGPSPGRHLDQTLIVRIWSYIEWLEGSEAPYDAADGLDGRYGDVKAAGSCMMYVIVQPQPNPKDKVRK